MTLVDCIALIIAIVVAVTVPIWLGGILHWRDIRAYNKTHSDKLVYTSQFTTTKRYRDWYLSNFCDKKETNIHDQNY